MLALQAKINKMTKIINALAIGATLLIASCSSEKTKHEGNFFGNDFESIDGWIREQPHLVKGDAHSGNYSIKVDSSLEFGYTFMLPMKSIATKPIKKVKVSIYCMFKEADTKAALVVSIDSPENVNLLYSGTQLQDFVKDQNKWEKVSVEVDLAKGKEGVSMPNNTVKIYVWNTSKKLVLSDDYEIEFLE
jgi:hypothetical protein